MSRRVSCLLVLGLGLGLAACAATPVVAPPSTVDTPSATRSVAPSLVESAPLRYPEVGPDSFVYATIGSPTAGHRGRLLTYRVAVERGITGTDANRFAAQVDAILDDPRSWTGTGRWRLRQVPAGPGYSFTVYLVTPATRDRLCGQGRDRYTSCRNGDNVVLNVARWAHGVPHYGADLATYRAYMVNHETGHRLGHGHELCPGPGRPAPVMQQQTLGLHGCVANAWPMVNGKPYAGRSGVYNDPVPPG